MLTRKILFLGLVSARRRLGVASCGGEPWNRCANWVGRQDEAPWNLKVDLMERNAFNEIQHHRKDRNMMKLLQEFCTKRKEVCGDVMWKEVGVVQEASLLYVEGQNSNHSLTSF